MSRRALVLGTLAAAIVAFAVAFAIAALTGPRAGKAPVAQAPAPSASGGLPVLWRVPSFSFTDQDGRPRNAESLRGHVWIADFVFTRCTTICPLITARMALLQRRLSNPELYFVSFSVDPAHDTPEALKRYASEWRPGESRWTLLATDAPGLERFAASMFVVVEPGEKDIVHSKLFFLVDQNGGVRGIYESDSDDALARLGRDATALAGPARAATPASPAADRGAELYGELGCGACHARPSLAPSLDGIAGRRVKLSTGAELSADAAYVRESIVAPDAKVVAGHVLRMPAYGEDLAPGELDALVAHVLAMKVPRPTTVAPKPSATASAMAGTDDGVSDAAAPSGSADANDANATEPAAIAVDPVCSMNVGVGQDTPRAEHAGRTLYFCSGLCRERFVADPERYTKTPTPP